MDRLGESDSGRRVVLRPIRSAAFSLIELLAVIVIVAILSVPAIQALGSIQKSYLLTQSANEILAALDSARQEAIARNRIIEVRFCREGAGDRISHLAVVEEESDGERKLLVRPIRLSDSLQIAETPQMNPLLNGRAEFDGGGSGDVAIPALGPSYRFRSFRFRPDGTTDLPWNAASNPQYFFTIQPASDAAAPSKNFALIQVDPLSGSTRLLRP